MRNLPASPDMSSEMWKCLAKSRSSIQPKKSLKCLERLNFKYSGRGNVLGLVYVSVCGGFFESCVGQHLNGTRRNCVCVYYNSMFLGANLTLGTKTAVTSLIMVRFNCFHLSVVAKNLGHNLHPQLLPHMCVCANEFRANVCARAWQSMSLGAQWKKYTLRIIVVRVRLGTPLPVS